MLFVYLVYAFIIKKNLYKKVNKTRIFRYHNKKYK